MSCNTRNLAEPLSEYLLGLAYDARKVIENDITDIQCEEFSCDITEGTVRYRGIRIIWTELLAQTAILRQCAMTCKNNQSQLAAVYLLEHLIESALRQQDSQVGSEVMRRYGLLGGLPDDYLVEFLNVQTRIFLEQPEGSKRLTSLPSILSNLRVNSPEYKAFAQDLLAYASDHGHAPEAIRTDTPWPEFNW